MVAHTKDAMLIAELLRSHLDHNGELHLSQDKSFALLRWVENAAKSQVEVAELLTELINLRERIFKGDL